ncbi:MAG: ABC transporter permease [Christensenellales bacterium]|jgi:ribose/xylose/arabinose/galactoside ABC-type transport system permease subunit
MMGKNDLPNSKSTSKRSTIVQLLERFSSGVILLGLVIILLIATPYFFQLNNALNIMRQVAIIGVMAIGQTMVIITGGIDLSVAMVVSLSGCMMTVLTTNHGWNAAAAIAAGLLVGVACGAINGLVVTKGKIPPFIATMGMSSICEGVALITTGGKTVTSTNATLNVLGRSEIASIPTSFLLFIVLAVVGWILLNHTTFGRNLFAVGGKEEAALLSGVKVGQTKFFVYTLSALLCSIGGLLMVGRISSASPIMAKGLELNTVAAAALGGASLNGGVGSISGTIIGIFTIGILNNGLDLLNVSSNLQKVVLGVVIIAVVILDTRRSKRLKA